jgi:hypothetical protein
VRNKTSSKTYPQNAKKTTGKASNEALKNEDNIRSGWETHNVC